MSWNDTMNATRAALYDFFTAMGRNSYAVALRELTAVRDTFDPEDAVAYRADRIRKGLEGWELPQEADADDIVTALEQVRDDIINKYLDARGYDQ